MFVDYLEASSLILCLFFSYFLSKPNVISLDFIEFVFHFYIFVSWFLYFRVVLLLSCVSIIALNANIYT